jgi:paraquat-inducible protein A
MRHKACRTCGQIHKLPRLSPGELARCVRCGTTVHDPEHAAKSAGRTAAASLGAFLLFWPAVLLPVIYLEGLGFRYDASLFFGSLHMLTHGNRAVGASLMIFVVVLPLVKVALLIELSALQVFSREQKTVVYRAMQAASRWSMLDVFAMAALMILVRLGSLVEFRFGPAAIALVLYVVMSIAATWSFDPNAIWEAEG